jgi:GNAT superfamily N-acetyltransferase
MRYHDFAYHLNEDVEKPKSRTYKDFTPEKNLVIVEDGYQSIWAYNGSPRLGGKKIGGAIFMGSPTDVDEKGERVFHIYKSVVDEKYRRKGVARALYDAVEKYCESKGGYLVPATSVSDEAFAFWNSWKPHRIAYDGRHWKQHYVGKIVQYKDQEWEIYHSGGHGHGVFMGRMVGGRSTQVIPRAVVIQQLGDFFPKDTPSAYPPPRHPTSNGA